MTVLDVDALFERAERDTGLSDFGDDSLPERVALVVDAVRGSDLDAAGEQAAADTIGWLLSSRLEFFDDRTRLPLADERIVAPVFATGEPRSGTTLLHALLSVDPAARALRFWEVMYPSPPPGLAGPDDPRRARADADWRDILERIPPWIVSHPYNDMLGDGLPECERTWAFDFRAMTPSAWWRVPMAMRPALPQDPPAQYAIHRMVLQHAQHGRPAARWVLKGFHGRRLRALFDTYPDARIIWVHRDPVKVIASQIAAFGQINERLTPSFDRERFAKDTLDAARRNLHAHLEDPLVDDPRIQHVPYQDFVRDPVATIGAFRDHAGIPFTTDSEAAMRTYLEQNRGDRYGRFVYSTDVLPEDPGDLDREFAAYRDRFGLETERRR